MTNSKQAAKRLRQSELRRESNKKARSAMRTAIKQVLSAPSSEEAAKILPIAMKRIDKAAKHNIIHDNTAARYKSRVARAVAAPRASD